MKKYTFFAIIVTLSVLALFCVYKANAAPYTQPLQCAATSIALNSPSTSATVQCPEVPPPPTAQTCRQGQAGDVPGYSCASFGTWKLKSGGGPPVAQPTQAYSFYNIFGDDWNGRYFGSSMVWTISNKQFLSIPFTPTPGHTITLSEASSFSVLIAESVSTAPGLFNDGKVGNDVVCVQAVRLPSLILSSNGMTGQCNLNPSVRYWFNIIPASYVNGAWRSNCTSAACNVAVTLYEQN